MRTDFTAEQLADPAMARSEKILLKCLQCGYCLDACPTYALTGNEADSARGRVDLIKSMFEAGGPPEASTVEHIDRCLSCLACMSSCPSFVNYMHLVDHARAYIEEHHRRPLPERMLRWSIAWTLPYPARLRRAVKAARLARPFAFALPGRLRSLVRSAPRTLPPPSDNDRPQVFPAHGRRERRVALLTGCAQQAIDTDINDATIRLLRRHGCEVVVADGAGCCGALTYHMGRVNDSRALAARNIRAWMKELRGEGLDAIVINTSGCGTVVKDYARMFVDDELAQDAATIASLARDVSELLSDIPLDYRFKPDMRVAYHATCSLQYGQRIRFAPRRLLKAAGFTVVEPRDSHTCCGAAGTYHLLQPELSAELRSRKVETLEALAPDVIAAGNIGCMSHIGAAARVPVVHTVELLDWVTGGPVPRALEGTVDPAEASG